MFLGVPEEVERILRERGIGDLTPPQVEAIPRILSGESVLIIAPTGVGKTEAVMIPFFSRIHRERPRPISMVYVTPMRALNRDLGRRLSWYGSRLGISVSVRHGDTPRAERRRQVLSPPDVLITTPETLQIALVTRSLRRHLSNVKFVVIDEVHELADTERGVQLSVALRRLRRLSGGFQVVGLSATLGNPEEVKELFMIRGPTIRVPVEKMMEVEVRAPGEPDHEIADKVGADPWFGALIRMILEETRRHKAVLVFTNTRVAAEDLAQRLRILGVSDFGVHHGSLSRNVRVEVEEAFKRGELRAVICTSSLELGIDIGRADYVIQLSSPRQASRLVQRIGRSGHGVGKVSRGSVLSHLPFELAESAAAAELAMGGWVEPRRPRPNPLWVVANQVMAMALEGPKSAEEIEGILMESPAFKDIGDRARQVMEFLDSVGVVSYRDGIVRKRRRTYRAFFENLSMIPDEVKWLVVEYPRRRMVGFLDESYVMTSVEPGSTFVLKGKVWRVISMEEDKRRILAEPLEDVSRPPRWEGEEVPVSREVAARASEIIRRGSVYLDGAAESRVKAISERGYPGSDELIIEEGRGLVVLLHPLGTKLANSLALYIASVIEELYSLTVGFDSSPYHVLIESSAATPQVVTAILRDGPDPEGTLRRVVEKTQAFKYVVYHTARKFGIRLDISRVWKRKVLDSLRGTPIWEEAVEKTLWDFHDVGGLKDLLKAVKAGGIRISSRPIGPVSEDLLSERRELYRSAIPTRALLSRIKKRLLSELFQFGCMNCRRTWRMRVYEFDEPRCPFCGGSRLVVAKKWEADKLRDFLEGRPVGRDLARKFLVAGSLVLSHGRKALIALAGHGVGPTTAARILNSARSEEDVVRLVFEAENRFEEIRRFMD